MCLEHQGKESVLPGGIRGKSNGTDTEMEKGA